MLHTHSFIYHQRCLCFSPSTSVSPVSIIPPMLHTHSFIYHPRCVMFFSQYFSFPCQYHSTNAPYSFIHLPPTLCNVFPPALQFPLSVSFQQYSTHSFIFYLHCVIFATERASLNDTAIIKVIETLTIVTYSVVSQLVITTKARSFKRSVL